MTGNRSIQIQVSPELLERMEARAVADQFNMREWLLQTVIKELLRPESEVAADRQVRANIAAQLSQSIRPTNERKPHAPHL